MMSSSAPQFPVLHRSLALDIKGHKTELVLCSYEDHFLIVASQIGTFGTILRARKEEGVTVEPTFSVSVVFGKRDKPMMVACGRQLIENISKSASPKPLVLSLGLKDHSLVRFMDSGSVKGIVAAVIENRLW